MTLIRALIRIIYMYTTLIQCTRSDLRCSYDVMALPLEDWVIQYRLHVQVHLLSVIVYDAVSDIIDRNCMD